MPVAESLDNGPPDQELDNAKKDDGVSEVSFPSRPVWPEKFVLSD